MSIIGLIGPVDREVWPSQPPIVFVVKSGLFFWEHHIHPPCYVESYEDVLGPQFMRDGEDE